MKAAWRAAAVIPLKTCPRFLPVDMSNLPLLLDPLRASRFMKITLRQAFTLFLIVAPAAAGLMAQPIGGPPPCWPPPCIPIDGGISALVAAGALLGGRKALQMRRSRKHTA